MLIASRDPSEMEIVAGGVGLVVFTSHFCQSTTGCCSPRAADSKQRCVFYMAALGLLTSFCERTTPLLQKWNKKLS